MLEVPHGEGVSHLVHVPAVLESVHNLADDEALIVTADAVFSARA